LFFTGRALSIINNPYAEDPTMQYLYILALSHSQNDAEDKNIANASLKLLELQVREYDRLIALANTLDQLILVEVSKTFIAIL
jgi:hypothetical protein